MKEIIFRRRFNLLDVQVAILCGVIAGNGYILSGIAFWIIGHIVVSAIGAVVN